MDSFIWTRVCVLSFGLILYFLSNSQFPYAIQPNTSEIRVRVTVLVVVMIEEFLTLYSLFEGSTESFFACANDLCKVHTLWVWVAVFLTRLSQATRLLVCPCTHFSCVCCAWCVPSCFLLRLQCLLVQWTSPLWAFLGIRELVDSIFLFDSAPFPYYW